MVSSKQVLIGTSGFNYSSWRGTFYPENLPSKDWLEYYSGRYPTVEINNSFYVAVRKSTYQKWYSQTPSDFSFVIKGHRMITQLKKLHEIDEPVELFFDACSGLSDKLSCVLWQFPASFRITPLNKEEYVHRLEYFLSLLPKHIGHAFEFRDSSWFTSDISEILRKYKAAFVFADTPRFPSEEIITSNFIYIRFHGPERLYASAYSDEQLQIWADKINDWKKTCKIYAYFNNDMSGFAIQNANTLSSMILT